MMSNGAYPSAPRRLSPGTVLNGMYEIDQQIGTGGMGEVYKGHTIATGDPVAIKMMLPELAESPDALALFRKEASALHSLQHGAIVRYYVFAIEPTTQRPYLAMEFIDGRALSDILRDGRLPFEAVRSLMQRVATGLQAAHEVGIIHRDVSPDNILIPGGDVARAKIIDFGIARSTNLAHGTVIGSGFAGKYNYVSPEQLGLFGGNVTAKSDIYSLGLVLVQALTGSAIDMDGSPFDVLEKRRKVPELGAIDLRFRPLLEKMLQPDPEQRPASMAEVASWPLNPPSVSRRGGFAATAPAAAAAAERAPRRWGYVVAAVLLLLVLLGGGGGYYYFAMQTPVAQAPPPFQPIGPSLADKQMTVVAPEPKRVAPAPAPAAPVKTVPPASGPVSTPTPAAPVPPVAAPAPAVPPPAKQEPTGPIASVRPDAGSRPDNRERIRRYVDEYDGGECFFVEPVAVGDSGATLEGFGSSTRPFELLDRAFQRDIGFEASIGVRRVTQPQCPAITFLGKLKAERGRAPRIQIGSQAVREGDVLTGTVENFGVRHVELLLISDSGQVQNVSALLKDGTDAKSFSIGMHRREGAAGQPQLLMAIAAPRVLDTLRPTGPVPADQFFLLAHSEASRAGIALRASARYFRIDP